MPYGKPRSYRAGRTGGTTALLVLLAGCGGDGFSGEGEPNAAESAAEEPARSRNAPGVHQVGSNEYEVVIQASEGGYSPSEIRVPVGAQVTFRLLSVDIPHGFFIDETGVKLSPVPEEYRETVHVFDSVRVHDFYCDEYCGGGHDFMRGRIIVE